MKLDSKSEKWIRTVNAVTIGWVAFFVVGLLAFDSDLFGLEFPILRIPDFLVYYWDVTSWII